MTDLPQIGTAGSKQTHTDTLLSDSPEIGAAGSKQTHITDLPEIGAAGSKQTHMTDLPEIGAAGSEHVTVTANPSFTGDENDVGQQATIKHLLQAVQQSLLLGVHFHLSAVLASNPKLLRPCLLSIDAHDGANEVQSKQGSLQAVYRVPV